ncbi:Hypp5161 [Branchiostoma lanceolatum]|uniref:Hypp5161 protein n=1 Tax=Branchiostoma lanceolatum TaxID=7740 RepID=A0A8K0ADM4_BRALA|nr:Hypp5161 [Branchiostoma lanceolatum]
MADGADDLETGSLFMEVSPEDEPAEGRERKAKVKQSHPEEDKAIELGIKSEHRGRPLGSYKSNPKHDRKPRIVRDKGVLKRCQNWPCTVKEVAEIGLVFACNMCDRQYTSPGGFRYHVKTVHKIEELDNIQVRGPRRPKVSTTQMFNKARRGKKVPSNSQVLGQQVDLAEENEQDEPEDLTMA